MNYPVLSSLKPGSNFVTNKEETLLFDAYLNYAKKTILIRVRDNSIVLPCRYTLSSLWKYLPSEYQTIPGDVGIFYTGKGIRVGLMRTLHVITPQYYLPNGIITDYREDTYTLSNKLLAGQSYEYPTWILKYFGPGEDEFVLYNTTIPPENYKPRENPMGYEKVPGEYIPKLEKRRDLDSGTPDGQGRSF